SFKSQVLRPAVSDFRLLLTSSSFSVILSAFARDSASVGRSLISPSPDQHDSQPLSGQLVVFTGKLSSLSRRDARALVARLGGATADDVNARTTMLVVGAEGFGSSQPDKSNKLKRAEDL